MSWLQSVLVLYALLNIGGGIAGFVSKGSVASLISGSVAGILIIGATILAGSNPKVGYIVAGIIAVADLGFFVMNIVRKGAGLWPAGVMVGASILVLICLAAAHFSTQPSPQ